MADPLLETPDDERETIKFHYLKSNFHRVVHVDGAIGGPTPKALIHCALFSERGAIPKMLEHELLQGTAVGSIKAVEGLEGITREIEVSLILDERTAGELIEWLKKQLEKLLAFRASNGDVSDTS